MTPPRFTRINERMNKAPPPRIPWLALGSTGHPVTPAERDEIRAMASAQIAKHSDPGRPSTCVCAVCPLARGVLRYMPPGDASDIEITVDRDAVVFDIREGSAYSPAGARSMAHAAHAAADAVEGSQCSK